ncbi:hypothetical protein Mal64_24280 [Pseudobythopirellula maris]|uniref:SLA1 homology domain-containing protein n=1 Tax=Pseudobythopirellula maris TaxID=2527991 RepID=A0A5C5ZP26_9BACT|nr:SHD1 domain-containing protein [Pseudobythopirellula maris]TWT88938.1 hypothetical protein Mal64_24280 [Pseudobythopirellula maris]
MAATLTGVPAWGQRGAEQEYVLVEITNYKRLLQSDSAPIEIDEIFMALGDRELADANQLEETEGTDPLEVISRLMILSLPETGPSSWQSRNNVFRLAPVTDFDAFVAGIDYGEVVSSEPSERLVRVRVDPAELSDEKYADRLRRSGRSPRSQRGMPEGFRGGPPEGLPKSLARDFAEAFDNSGFGDRAFSDRVSENRFDEDDDLQEGDHVELLIAGEPYEAIVRSPDSLGRVRVVLVDKQRLAEKFSRRKQRTTIERLSELAFLAPRSSLYPIDPTKPGGSGFVLRTWSDRSGSYKIEAVYAGVDGDAVKLSKRDGEELRVPLDRLSADDQSYVRAAREQSAQDKGNPFASAANPFSGARSVLALLKKPDFASLKEIRGKEFASWQFSPNDYAVSPKRAFTMTKAVELTPLPDQGNRGEEMITLDISRDGRRAIVQRKVDGGSSRDRVFLEMLDLAGRRSAGLIELPQYTKALAVRPESALVLLGGTHFNDDMNTKVTLAKITRGGLKTIALWEPSPRDTRRRGVDQAWFTGPRHALLGVARSDPVLWDLVEAKAVFKIPVGDRFYVQRLGAMGRLLAVGSESSVSLLDLRKGRHLATVEHDLSRLEAVGLSDDCTRLIASSIDQIAAWDLADGSPLGKLTKSKPTSDERLDWVDDMLVLADGQRLYDLNRGIMLWEYGVSTRGGLASETANGRIWYGPRNEDGQDPYIASIEVPHHEARAHSRVLGEQQAFLAARPGDPFELIIETDQGAVAERDIEAKLTDAVQNAGFAVADSAPLQVRVVYTRLPERDLRIRNWNEPPWTKKFVIKTIRPFASALVLTDGEDNVLWRRGWLAEPMGIINMREGESLDDALERLTSPNPDWLSHIEFPKKLTKPGPVTEEGAYGYSRLSIHGVASNRTEAKE